MTDCAASAGLAAPTRVALVAGGGRIVLVTSQGGAKVLPGVSGYCVSKAAQRTAMMAAASELPPHGIAVDEVAPGTAETDINRDLLAVNGGSPIR